MGVAYAEVIGDPIAHSKSPLIHRFWLEKLGLRGDYRATRVVAGDLAAFLEARRRDIWWRGCNVTAPLKESASELVGSPEDLCRFVGAVNCITRTPLACLFGTNTDIAGVAEALRDTNLEGATVCLVGSGGAARSVLCHLHGKPISALRLLARNAAKATKLVEGFGRPVDIMGFDQAAEAMSGASLVVNATPLGMTGRDPMPEGIVEALATADTAATVFDTVYAPLETGLLRGARARGLRTVDGLAMLVGQAAPAFELFFGEPAPREHDSELRTLLAQ